MKLKSTADGLKAVKVNPYEQFGDGPHWIAFEETNPTLYLTTPMPCNTVFEGVEVWQGLIWDNKHDEGNGGYEWEIIFDSAAEWFNRHHNDESDIKKIRRAYQPLEVKEQSFETIKNKVMGDIHLNHNSALETISDFNKRMDFKEQVREEATVRAKNAPTEIKAANPELGVEEAAESWLEEQGGANGNIAPDFIRSFIAGANWQKQQSKDETIEEFGKRSFDESPYGKGLKQGYNNCKDELVAIIEAEILRHNSKQALYTVKVLTSLLATINKK